MSLRRKIARRLRAAKQRREADRRSRTDQVWQGLEPLEGRILLTLVTDNMTVVNATDLAQFLAGDGIEVSNARYTGGLSAAGLFSGAFGEGFSFDEGVILSSGNIADAAGPNDSDATGTDLFKAGDSQLTQLAGDQTYDAAILEFDFVPTEESLSFQYILASEEYNEFVFQFNDVFAFYIDGVNVALTPGTNQPVTINTINKAVNSNIYRNNDLSDFGVGGVPFGTEFDGFTAALQSRIEVTANQTHSVKLVIADAGDGLYDSAVFLGKNSFVSGRADVAVEIESDFDPAALNDEMVLTYTVTNNGPDAASGVILNNFLPDGVTFVSVTSSQGDASFAGGVITAELGNLAAGESATVDLTVIPTSVGVVETTVDVSVNQIDVNTDNNTATLQVTVAEADIQIDGNGVVIVDGDTTPSTGDLTDLGFATVFTETASSTFTISNVLDGPLRLDGSTPVQILNDVDGEFSIVSPPQTSYGQGDSDSFTVLFTPTVEGVKTVTISIGSNDADEDPFTFVLRAEAQPLPDLDVRFNGIDIESGDDDPSALDGTLFGPVTQLLPVVHTYTVTNNGEGPLRFKSSPIVTFTGPNAADFSIVGTVPDSIDPGESVQLQIRFRPLQPGERSAQMVFATSNSLDENPFMFAVGGTSIAKPIVAVTNDANATAIADGDFTPSTGEGTDFGTADAGGAGTTRTYRITNTGAGPLNISDTMFVGPNALSFNVVSAPPATIAAGASATFTVEFDPTAIGLNSATLLISTNDADHDTYAFAVRGSGTASGAPEIFVQERDSASPIVDGDSTPSVADGTDFGTVGVGLFEDRTYDIFNTGGGVLDISSLTIVGAAASDYRMISSLGDAILPGESTRAIIRFTPTAGGVRRAALSIANNDSDESPFNFTMTGTGFVRADIAVTFGQQTITDGDTTPTTVDGTHFGSVPFTLSSVQTFSIRNTGLGTLELTGDEPVVISGMHASDFTVITQPTLRSIAPGLSTTFQVRFTPGAENATRYAALKINSNDPDESPYNFSIRGVGGPRPVPEIGVSGNSVDITDGDTTPTATDWTEFASTPVGMSSTRTFTITNSGTAALNLASGVEILGMHASEFTVISQPSSSIEAGGSATFQVQFTPTQPTTRFAAIRIANDDSDENPFNFAIQGLVPAPEIVLTFDGNSIEDGDTTPSTVDGTSFGNVGVGDSVEQTYTILNAGDDDLTVGTVAISGMHAADFEVISQPDAIVEDGATTTFTVRFTPSALNTRFGAISFITNDFDESPFNFRLIGVGIPPAEASLAFGATDVADGDTTPSTGEGTDFGFSPTGVPVERTFTLTNIGTADLVVESIDFVGTHAADFVVTDSPPAAIASGMSGTFTVRFSPGDALARYAGMRITYNNPDEPVYNVSITGRGGIVRFDESDVDTTDGPRYVDVAAGDIDGDGDVDLASADNANGVISWHENDGSGNFTTHVIFSGAEAATNVAIADIDGDGDMDIVGNGPADGVRDIFWFDNDGSENFTQRDVNTDTFGSRALVPVDLDDDGDVDVVTTSFNEDTVAWHENDGSENFTQHVIATGVDGAQDAQVVDFDDDGDLDIVFAARNGDLVAWLDNLGNETFVQRTISSTIDGPQSVFVVDLDQDGDLDVLAAALNGDAAIWFENEGDDVSFTTRTIAALNEPEDIAAVDIDSDGDLDVLVASILLDSITILFNNGSQVFTQGLVGGADGMDTVITANIDNLGEIDIVGTSNEGIFWYSYRPVLMVTSATSQFDALALALQTSIEDDSDDAEGQGEPTTTEPVEVATQTVSDDAFGWLEGQLA